jgi:hypothetical protein
MRKRGARNEANEKALFYALNPAVFAANLLGGGRSDFARRHDSNAKRFPLLRKPGLADFCIHVAVVKRMVSRKIVVHNTKRGLMSYIRLGLCFKTKI